MPYTDPLLLAHPDDTRRLLGAWVRTLRQRREWTQAMLASKAGVPASTLSLFERSGNAGMDSFLRLLAALGELDRFHTGAEGWMKAAALPRTLAELEAREEAAASYGARKRVRVRKEKP